MKNKQGPKVGERWIQNTDGRGVTILLVEDAPDGIKFIYDGHRVTESRFPVNKRN